MTRKEFIKICSLLGISIPLQPLLAKSYQTDYNHITSNKFEGKVLIIGAGAAGLTAAYKLFQKGIDFQILEASSSYGGRMKTAVDFVDFPIPLGAEWLHVERSIFSKIVNKPNINLDFTTKSYTSEDYGLYLGEEVSMEDIGFDIDQKFIGFSWLDFFKKYLIPSIEDTLLYNQVVKSINYTTDKIIVKTSKDIFTADKVILTTPVKMLKNNAIEFTPQLPEDKRKAINKATVWDGFKAFIEFSEKFYPTAIGFKTSPRKSGQKMYYDASYGQNSKRHVLGLFTVGSGTLPYKQLSDSELIKYILNELDEIFDGKASSNYIKHISQNWNKEPFINGAYVYDHESWRTVRELGKSVHNKIFFAGTAYTDGSDWGSVHSAANSAIRAVNELLV